MSRRSTSSILMAIVLAVGISRSAAAQCWDEPTAHAQNGLNDSPGASTTWDPDGPGPLPTCLVVAGSSVAVWDGSAFSYVGGFANGEIRSLAVYNGELYAGGTFSQIGSDFVNNVARWNGTDWVQLNLGMSGQGDGYNPKGSVSVMVVLNGLLYLGGSFVPGSSGTWTSFATWDGATLAAGKATQAPITDLEVVGGLLYASTYNGAPGVLRYDSPNWTQIGTLADHGVQALASYNGSLIAGGIFTHWFTGQTISGVARWSGTAWVPMGGGITGGIHSVTSLQVYNGRLYAAGVFTTADGQPSPNVAVWDGTAWSAVGTGLHLTNGGLNNGVNALTTFNGELLALGHIDQAGGLPAHGIARWNDSEWNPFISGINGRVRTIVPVDGGFYVGGDFDFTWSAAPIHHVFFTDGNALDYLAGSGAVGVNGFVSTALLHYFGHLPNPGLVVGGFFSVAGNTTARNVAVYGSDGWSELQPGFNNAVNSIVDYNGTLYAAGAFTATGNGTALPHLAKYPTLGGWTDPGAGSFSTLSALMSFGGNLIIGGVPGGNGVSAWNGTALTNYGAANGAVYALSTYQGDIVAAGAFTTIGGVAASHIARRNSVTGQWSALGAGFTSDVRALAVLGSTLYAGGLFISSGATPMYRIGSWDGASWNAVGGGLDAPVYALAVSNGKLEVGGDFSQSEGVGAIPSPNWIESSGVCATAVGPILTAAPLRLSPSYPNPTRGSSNVRFTLPRAGRTRLVVLDIAGRTLRTLADGLYAAGEHFETWDGRGDRGDRAAPGVYFLRLDQDGVRASAPVVLTR